MRCTWVSTRRGGRARLLAVAAAVACGTPDVLDDDRPEGADSEARDSDVEVVPSPARVHRLTRAQLARATRDLLGVEVDVDPWLSPDVQTEGFDNTEDGLYLAPEFLRGWDGALSAAIARALSPGTVTVEPWQVRALVPTLPEPDDDGYVAIGRQTFDLLVTTVAGGEHLLAIEVRAVSPLDPGVVDLQLDHVVIASAVEPLDELPGDHVVRGRVVVPSAGRHTLHVELPEDASFRAITLAPPDDVGPAPSRAALLTCAPAADDDAGWGACARSVLAPLARRAWRRPVEEAELDALAGAVVGGRARGEDFGTAVGTALEAMLLSPSFVFRVEPPGAGPVDDHVLASRLAFFLWSSLPDDALLDLADRGELHEPATLRAQVARMLASPRRQGFVEDFAGQWLGFRDLGALQRDPATFPLDGPALRAAMLAETSALVGRLLDGELAVADALTEPLGDVPAPLHRLYGLDAPGTALDLTVVGRGGLLGNASILTATATPTRTSVVQRGKFVLNALLCTSVSMPPVVPAPNEADPLRDVADRAANPACRTCHAQMDPLGTALEHFDPVGAWRDVYPSGVEVSSDGAFPDGTLLHGLADLERVLAADERVGRCLVQRVLTWAAGRGIGEDHPAFAPALAAFEADGGRLPGLLEQVATSDLLLRHVEAR
jgi:hypothetical protein